VLYWVMTAPGTCDSSERTVPHAIQGTVAPIENVRATIAVEVIFFVTATELVATAFPHDAVVAQEAVEVVPSGTAPTCDRRL
jgi:hypothetical protein